MEPIKAKKSLGQNFLKDEQVLKKIANSFSINSNDLIIEIGPGTGALTKYLVQKSSSLLCYELDERLQPLLISFKSDKCNIIFDDFLKRDLKQDIKDTYEHIYVIANIPYYITTPILTHILESNVVITGLCLLVQKEVAKRFSSQPGTRDYGYFTVLLNHYFDVELLFDVPSSSFVPAPKVTSSVVRLIRKEKIVDVDIKKFQEFLKQAFSLKRKTLKNNLKGYDWSIIEGVLKECFLDINIRAENVSYEVFLKIFKRLFEN